MAKDLSVIIVNWNTGALLRDCVESVYRETVKHSLEVIVVDNASSDNSIPLVEKEFASAVVIKNSKNLGFAKGNNIGVEAAEGKYVILLNPDTKVLDGALDKICSFMESAGDDVGAAGPVLLNKDGSFQTEQGMRFPGLGTAFAQYFFLSRLFGLPGIFMNHAPPGGSVYNVDWLCGACLASPRKIYKEMGGLDEKYFMYAEDMDYCYRLKEKGYRTVFCPEANIMHISKQSTSKQGEEISKFQIESLKEFFRTKNPAWKYAIFKNILFGGLAIRFLILSFISREKARSMRILLKYVYV
ncbi:MAG TPA: glycosyltransferase family 2 protein [Candidatus Omnitrophota bacterium]|nr:glycosyltransferase family 2 protein [Candidatus Omnitrophota bacterium]